MAPTVSQTISFMETFATIQEPLKGCDSPRSDVSLCTDLGGAYLEHLL